MGLTKRSVSKGKVEIDCIFIVFIFSSIINYYGNIYTLKKAYSIPLFEQVDCIHRRLVSFVSGNPMYIIFLAFPARQLVSAAYQRKIPVAFARLQWNLFSGLRHL